MTSVRKAAVLLRNLDPQSAARLLSELSPEEADKVRSALRSVRDFDTDELAEIACELRDRRLQLDTIGKLDAASEHKVRWEESRGDPGVELDLTFEPSRSSQVQANEQASELRHLATEAATRNARPFQFLLQSEAEVLAQFLHHEHPQTIALVLSYVEPARAAAILAAMSEELQSEVVLRLAELEETDPESIRVVEQSLETRLAKRRCEQQRKSSRMLAVRSILAAVEQQNRQNILLQIGKRNQDLAQAMQTPAPALPQPPKCNTNSRRRISKNDGSAKSSERTRQRITPARLTPSERQPAPVAQLDIDDLLRLSDADLARVLAGVDRTTLELALAGASERLVGRVARQIPRKQAGRWLKQLRNLVPMSLRDIEYAQRLVCQEAEKLLGTHEIAFTL